MQFETVFYKGLDIMTPLFVSAVASNFFPHQLDEPNRNKLAQVTREIFESHKLEMEKFYFLLQNELTDEARKSINESQVELSNRVLDEIKRSKSYKEIERALRDI